MSKQTEPPPQIDIAVDALAAAGHAPFFEGQTIRPIPENERHGRPRDLFTIWFAANLGPLAFINGALGPAVFGLSFVWSVVAILAGVAGGGLLMAFHSAQGPLLGLPQMIQTRGQFGALGSLVILFVVLIMYLGFFASASLFTAEALQTAVGGLSVDAWLILITVLAVSVAAVGYRYIHWIGAFATVGVGLLLVGAVVVMIVGDHVPGGFSSAGGFSFTGFLSMASIAALWLIAFAPYVSDYSRYMPKSHAGVRSTFWFTYWGAMLGALLPMVLGAAIAVIVGGEDVLGGMSQALGEPGAKILLIGFAFVGLHVNAMNLYGGALTGLSTIQTWRPKWSPTALHRIVCSVVMATIAVVLALVFTGNFITNYVNFVLLLTYTLVPWSIINLLDFYVVKHGNYDVDSLLAHKAGKYGNWRWPALTAYLIGIAVEVPFVSSPFFTGPVAEQISGADISWIVSAVVTIPLYLFLARRERDQGEGDPVPRVATAAPELGESPSGVLG